MVQKIEKIKKRILIIDDDDGVLGALTAILEMEGYLVETSSNSHFLDGHDKKNAPNLILLDFLVSGENGKDILKKIRAHSSLVKVPIIMLSAYPNVEKELLDSGADAFIGKPFDMDNLLMQVKNLVI